MLVEILFSTLNVGRIFPSRFLLTSVNHPRRRDRSLNVHMEVHDVHNDLN